MNVVIVGNGILALTTAFRLSQRLGPHGHRITLVGKQARPGSATLAAAAMLNSFAELEADSLDSEVDLYRFELSHLATRMWPRFIDEVIRAAGERLPGACARCEGLCGGCYSRGTFIVNTAEPGESDDENFEAIAVAAARFDEPHSHIAPGDIPNYAPDPSHLATRALHLPNEGWLNPRLTVEALEAALRGAPHVQWLEGHVDRLEATGTVVGRAVLTTGAAVEGDAFVLASGATVGDILERSRLGLSVQRIFYGVGESVELHSPRHPHTKAIRTPRRRHASGLYTVPYFVGPNQPHDHILIGATSVVSATAVEASDGAGVERLRRRAAASINRHFRDATVVRTNLGWRPTSQDTYPLVGKTRLSNLTLATGTRRDGFHLAPVLSEYLASMVLGLPVDARFSVFAPERPLIRGLTRAQGIDKGVRHQLSVAALSGEGPGPTPADTARCRDELERLHDAVGATTWGIPPELIEMYRAGHAPRDGNSLVHPDARVR